MRSLSNVVMTGLMCLCSLTAMGQGVGSDAVTQMPSTASPAGGAGFNPAEAKSDFGKLKAYLVKYPDVNNQVSGEMEKLGKLVDNYATNQEKCKSREDMANTYCMESRNPEIKKYLMVTQVLTAGVSGMADACSKFGKVMDLGNKLLTGYQAACGSARGFCTSACGEAKKNIEDLKSGSDALAKTVTAQAQAAATKYATSNPPLSVKYSDLAANFPRQVKQYHAARLDPELKTDGDYRAVAQKLETCHDYAAQLATSAVGLVSMVKSFGEANNCEDDSTSSASAAATPVDCTIAENKANNMTCICQDNPRMAGCDTTLDSATIAKSMDSLRAASTSDYTPTVGTDGKIDIGSDSNQLELASKAQDGGGSSLPGAPGGGSAGLGGSGGGFGGGANSQAKSKAAGLNTNILGGEGGGGGGGGSWGSGGGGDPSLRQYLPGGAKDPMAFAGAGQGAVSKQVTSQGGKSNWEKVRERYRDNKPRLLGN